MTTRQKTRLYVIRKRFQEQFWTCSNEHGAGWTDKHPKQAFSPSELTREIRRLIDQGWMTDLIIVELCMPSDLDGDAGPDVDQSILEAVAETREAARKERAGEWPGGSLADV